MSNEMQELFGEVIHAYTRAQALEDGVLVDVSAVASEAGFKVPVALTAKLWSAIEAIPARGHGAWGDVQGRLWDVVWMARLASRRGGERIDFQVILPFRGTRKRNQILRAFAGPGDAGEMVITIGFQDDEW